MEKLNDKKTTILATCFDDVNIYPYQVKTKGKHPIWIVRKHKYQELWWLFNTKTNTWLHQDFWSEAEANTKCKALNEKEIEK